MHVQPESCSSQLTTVRPHTHTSHHSLPNNRISSIGTRVLVQSGWLGTNASLTTLSLRRNRIGPDGAACLAGALQHNVSITKLEYATQPPHRRRLIRAECTCNCTALLVVCHSLACCDVRDEGALALFRLLTSTPALPIKRLDLSDNALSSESGSPAGTMLHVHSTLEVQRRRGSYKSCCTAR